MNKFEQEVDYILDYVPVSVDKAIQSISTLHDKEMIEFAEWCEERCHFSQLKKKWAVWEVGVKNDYKHTTSELLTIFRNQQK